MLLHMLQLTSQLTADRNLTSQALAMENVENIRLLLNNALDHADIGGLVRAGK